MAKMTSEVDKMQALVEEELHPDLVPYQTVLNGVPCIKHPLVNVMFPINGMVNRSYEQKTAEVERLESIGDYGTMLWFYEKPWRLDMVLMWNAAGYLSEELFPELLGQAWTDVELPHQTNKDWLVRGFKRAGFLSDTDMPKPEHPLTIFRGGNRTGLSWTMSLDKAVWFAQRWPDKYTELWQATIRPQGVLAVFHERGESEVVVNYRMLKDRQQLDPDHPI